MNYESILAEVLKNCDEHEKERIMQEDALFQRRGWRKMIELLCGLIEKTEKSHYIYSYAGSFLDSYLVYKFAKLRQINLDRLYRAFWNGGKNIGQRLLNGEKASSTLFNDALRAQIVSFSCRSASEEISIERKIICLAELNSFLDALIHETGLRNKGALIDSSTELLVLSNDEITNSEMEIILNEEKKSKPEEIEVLHKVLIVRIKTENGL